MKKLLLLFSLVLTGCVTGVDPSIPSNVTLSSPDAYNNQYIESIKFNLDNEYVNLNPTKCLILTVNNNEYTLSDSSSSFVGAYTGNYYNIEKSRQVGGGKSLLYSDEISAIAR